MKINSKILRCMTSTVEHCEYVKKFRKFPSEKHLGYTKCILCGERAEVWRVEKEYAAVCISQKYGGEYCGMTQELGGKPLEHLIKMVENNILPATISNGKLQYG